MTDPLAIFKSLADETRLRLMVLIQLQGELCVCELTEALAESQPKISRHLALLKKAGLLKDRRQGQWIFYRVSPELPGWVETILQQSASASKNYISENLANLEQMADRPVNCC